jgi:hypothetical protein
MEPDAYRKSETQTAPLVVADWTIDPEAVVTACRMRLGDGGRVHLLVPAWLHGLDWVGDPFASVPCARRQLERMRLLCLAAGLRVESTAVGDPDPVSAICDAADATRADRILLVARGRHVSPGYPLSVARRAQRLTGVRVESVAAPIPPRPRRSRAFAAGHCGPVRAVLRAPRGAKMRGIDRVT